MPQNSPTDAFRFSSRAVEEIERRRLEHIARSGVANAAVCVHFARFFGRGGYPRPAVAISFADLPENGLGAADAANAPPFVVLDKVEPDDRRRFELATIDYMPAAGFFLVGGAPQRTTPDAGFRFSSRAIAGVRALIVEHERAGDGRKAQAVLVTNGVTKTGRGFAPSLGCYMQGELDDALFELQRVEPFDVVFAPSRTTAALFDDAIIDHDGEGFFLAP